MKNTTYQQCLFKDESAPPALIKIKRDISTTFIDNVSLPVHRWFKFSAGFSALWVSELLQRERANGRLRVIDPFVGSGTVAIEADKNGLESIGLEAQPFIYRIANAKSLWNANREELKTFGLSVLNKAKRMKGIKSKYGSLINRCFEQNTLEKLDHIKEAWVRSQNNTPCTEITWLVLNAILRPCSKAGTAQWQYVLPRKSKSKTLDPFSAFENLLYMILWDMKAMDELKAIKQSIILKEDARTCAAIPQNWADLLITSPPYANNYDYADATRLELSFWGDVANWGGLHDAVRVGLVRSCTQHVAKERNKLEELLSNKHLDPIQNGIKDICFKMSVEKDNHGGKKPYDRMIASYFIDLAQVFYSLRRVMKKESLLCFVIGDSAPYGIYVPVDQWLGELAISAGFMSYTFEKTRDRNIKWKNRKHRVPLKEGRLWING